MKTGLTEQTNRNARLDFLKGFSMLAIVFYHIGFWDNAYLGVELFFVINGYLITSSILKIRARNMNSPFTPNKFQYFHFVIYHIIRRWPLVLLASIISLIIGYFTMLPDDFENLAQSVVASNIFSNNLSGHISAANYWDTNQLFKPLMQTWYLGIIIEFYVIYPLFISTIHKLSKKKDWHSFVRTVRNMIAVLCLISFILYLFTGNTSDKFYYLPYRFYELGIGCLIALAANLSIRSNCGEHSLRNKTTIFRIGFPLSVLLLSAILIVNYQ